MTLETLFPPDSPQTPAGWACFLLTISPLICCLLWIIYVYIHLYIRWLVICDLFHITIIIFFFSLACVLAEALHSAHVRGGIYTQPPFRNVRPFTLFFQTQHHWQSRPEPHLVIARLDTLIWSEARQIPSDQMKMHSLSMHFAPDP